MQISIYGFHGRGVETAARVICNACAKSNISANAIVFSGNYKKAIIKFDQKLLDKDFSLSDFCMFIDNIPEKEFAEKSNVLFNSPSAVSNALFKKNKISSHYLDAFSISTKPNMAMLGAFAKLQSKLPAKSLRSAIEPYGSESLAQFEEGYKRVK